MNNLTHISIQLPLDNNFTDDFLELLAPLGNQMDNQIEVASTNTEYIPQLSIGFADLTLPRVTFRGGETDVREDIINQTGQQRESSHDYVPLSISEIKIRVERAGSIETVDHLGVNFPWFDGLSPSVVRLRRELSRYCAYYRFPTGEEWDFIIPATEQEINLGNVDLSKNRRPKFELVSFEKSSRPIIQIDCITSINYEKLKHLFPEAILDDELRNVWVYLENPYELDICLILNEPSTDWSSFFEGHRIVN